MNSIRIVAFALIVVGLLALAYGGFSYTKETSSAKLGPLELKVQEKESVNVPIIVSVGAIGVGIFLLVAGRNK